jgi:hypothetical protein
MTLDITIKALVSGLMTAIAIGTWHREIQEAIPSFCNANRT